MNSTRIQKILLLDDDRIQKFLVEKRLLKIDAGVEFVYFESPKEALTYLKSESVDCILLDLNMPEMNGWDFVNEVEKLGQNPILILQTGSVENEHLQRANSDKRISSILEKPLSESDLRSILGL